MAESTYNLDMAEAPNRWPGEASELIEQLREGGANAFAELFSQHRSRLRREIQSRLDRRLARRVDASDILQETYLDAARRVDEYLADPPMPLFTWLRFLANQRVMAAYRRHLGTQKRDPRQEAPLQSSRREQDRSEALSFELSACLTSPSHALARAETQRRIRELLDSLDPIDREILVLRHLEELANNQVAQRLGLSKAAASNRYIRALERLRQIMSSLSEFDIA